ncbi:MAG TPA: polyprenyl synthetase family protein [Candidatus Binatia bacterium]|nr:polyprenyl synthetase family protein [Candidatus Binatia bacterium]
MTHALVSTTLQEYGSLTRAALERYLPDREPRRHLYDLLAEYPRRPGKMMRSSLCIATARAFGARLEDALGTAVAIELLHNALLIHDDIEDGSEQRRGKPTLHVLHGVPLALNAGDTLTLLSLRPLIENATTMGARLSLRILAETERMARESAEGQAMELGWRRDNTAEVDEAAYLEMVLKKTCWLATIYPSRVGALIGAGDGIDLEPFVRFGFFVGAAFQIQDDVLNLVGDWKRYGKERDGDIWEGKRTLMIIHLLRESTADERERLHGLLRLSREEKTAEQVRWIRARMDTYGSIDYAGQIARGLAGAALHEYSLVFAGLPASRDKQFIEGIATWVLDRT